MRYLSFGGATRSQNSRFGFVALVALPLLALVSACGSDDCAADGTCSGSVGPDGGSPEGSVPVPADCKEEADSSSAEAKGCIVDSFAVFVSTGGSDASEGTKERPLQTIGAAVTRAAATGKRRIYVCGAGPYPEAVKLTAPVSVFGGFVCGSWDYGGTRAKVGPTGAGYALHIDGTANVLTIADLDFAARDASEDGASSIAAFVNKANVRFVRTGFAAGAPKSGGVGASGETGKLTAVSSGAFDLNGNPEVGAVSGATKECTCSTTGAVRSSGGAGGGDSGGDGMPPLGGGKHGMHTGGDGCNDMAGYIGGSGNAAPAAAPATPSSARGGLSGDGWHPQVGPDGTANGGPGQGGGGGGPHGGGGGGGACGGCGGTPGKGGQGGGASIALLANESTVSLASSTLSTQAGAAGGTGGAGGEGGEGGTGGEGSCSGGSGGKGGNGSAGAGGAGGLSVGILFKLVAPVVDPATQITVGAAGNGGTGGKPGVNNGPDGVSEKVKDAAQL